MYVLKRRGKDMERKCPKESQKKEKETLFGFPL